MTQEPMPNPMSSVSAVVLSGYLSGIVSYLPLSFSLVGLNPRFTWQIWGVQCVIECVLGDVLCV